MSEIRANTIANAAGTGPAALTGQSALKTFATLQGTGTVQALKSLNVSSVTDDGTGNYSVNFTSAFADTNTSSTLGSTAASGGFPAPVDEGRATTTIDVGVARCTTEVRADVARLSIGMNGDLA